MAKRDETDWLDDAFDDKKAKEELEIAKNSGRMGCLLAFVVALVAAFVLFAFIGMVGALQSL